MTGSTALGAVPRRGIVVLLVALVAGLALTATRSEAAVPCTTACARVATITPQLTTISRFPVLLMRVAVRNESGAAVPGAIVRGTWQLPGGRQFPAFGVTLGDGTATMPMFASWPGQYTLTISSVWARGLTFDPAASVLSAIATV